MKSTCTTGVEHVLEPDINFCCKMRYWRDGGAGFALAIPSDWRGPSVAVRQKEVISDALAAGYDPQPVSDKARWI